MYLTPEACRNAFRTVTLTQTAVCLVSWTEAIFKSNSANNLSTFLHRQPARCEQIKVMVVKHCHKKKNEQRTPIAQHSSQHTVVLSDPLTEPQNLLSFYF